MEFSNHDELGRIEAALRSERPRLDGEVESAICGRVGARSSGGRRASFAVVLTVGSLIGMSAFGGVGYANFGFFGFNPFHPPHIYKPPFKDQYGKGPKHHPTHPSHPTHPGKGLGY
jgi:hypothetical protein